MRLTLTDMIVLQCWHIFENIYAGNEIWPLRVYKSGGISLEFIFEGWRITNWGDNQISFGIIHCLKAIYKTCVLLPVGLSIWTFLLRSDIKVLPSSNWPIHNIKQNLPFSSTSSYPFLPLSNPKFDTFLIPPSHLFRISKNQAEPAGMKNFQNSRHIREGISNPVTLEAEWAGMTAELTLFIYS